MADEIPGPLVERLERSARLAEQVLDEQVKAMEGRAGVDRGHGYVPSGVYGLRLVAGIPDAVPHAEVCDRIVERLRFLEARVTELQASASVEVERRRAAEAMAPPPDARHDGRLAEAWRVVGQLVLPELDRAWSSFPRPAASLHEAHAVMFEEVDELWDEVKKRNPDRAMVRKEARQVAAMAVRLIVELCGGVS